MRLSPDYQSAADGRAEDAALASTAVQRRSERRGWRAVWLAFGTWVLYPGVALVRDFGYRPEPWILAPLFIAALGVAVVGVGLSVLCLCDKSGRGLGMLGLIMNGLTVLTNCLFLWEWLATLARIPGPRIDHSGAA